jgi:hypothetical protein
MSEAHCLVPCAAQLSGSAPPNFHPRAPANSMVATIKTAVAQTCKGKELATYRITIH